MNKKIIVNIFALATVTLGCEFGATTAPKSMQDVLKDAFATRRPAIEPDRAAVEKAQEKKASEKPKIEGSGKDRFKEMQEQFAGKFKPRAEAPEVKKVAPVKIEEPKAEIAGECYHKKYILRLIELLKQDIRDIDLLDKVAELEKSIEPIDQGKLSRFNQQRLMVEALFVADYSGRRLNIFPMLQAEKSESIFVALCQQFIGQDLNDCTVLPQRYYDIQKTQGFKDFFGFDKNAYGFRKRISDVRQACSNLPSFAGSIILPMFDLHDRCRDIAVQFNKNGKHISIAEFNALKNEIYQTLIFLRSIKADKLHPEQDDCFVQTLIKMFDNAIEDISSAVE